MNKENISPSILHEPPTTSTPNTKMNPPQILKKKKKQFQHTNKNNKKKKKIINRIIRRSGYIFFLLSFSFLRLADNVKESYVDYILMLKCSERAIHTCTPTHMCVY